MQEYRPIAAWLKTTRERQLDEKGDPWTQDHLLALMHAEVGWAPYRPNYSKYESGKATPKRETLAKFVRFWEQRGEPGPVMDAPAEPPSEQAQLIAALTAHTEAIAAQTAAMPSPDNGSTSAPGLGALIEAIAAQTAAMSELVAELRAMRGTEPEPPIVERARAAVAAVDSAAGQARSTPPLRRRGRDRRGAGGSQRSRESEAS